MRSLWKMTLTELKLYLREPIAAFFTLVFPVMLLLIFGSIYGNEPQVLFGGRGTVDMSVPAYMAMIIGTLAACACRMASIVCGWTPSSAATISTTISVAWAPRARMFVNASWPGVSRNVICWPSDSETR